MTDYRLASTLIETVSDLWEFLMIAILLDRSGRQPFVFICDLEFRIIFKQVEEIPSVLRQLRKQKK